MVVTTILVELLRWGFNLLTAGGSTTVHYDEEATIVTTTVTTITTLVTSITTTTIITPSLDERVQLYMKEVRRRQNMG